MQISKQQLFKRQTTLAEFGEIGQDKLLKAKVIVIGCGGLGNSAAVYLASSGVGKLHLVDFDSVAISNLHRQVFFKISDVGKSKSEILSNYIQQITPFLKVTNSNEAISKSNILETINEYDIVLDCTDNLPVKYLINDACVLKGKVLIYGSLYKFDGYVGSFNTLDKDGNRTANLRDAFPEIPKHSIPNCSEAGTLNTIVGIIGLMQANEVLKIVSEIGRPLANKLQIYNSLDNSQYTMHLKNSFSKEKIQDIFETESYTDINCEIQKEELLITSEELKGKNNIGDLEIISVIENKNAMLPFEVTKCIPFSKLDLNVLNVNPEKEYIIVCNKGILSYAATVIIKEKYPSLKVFSLKGGIINY